MDEGCFPEIETLLDLPKNSPLAHLQEEIIRQNLKKALPKTLWHSHPVPDDLFEDQRKEFLNSLPHVWATKCLKAPGNISFFTFYRLRPNAFKFFFEMVAQWLIPGKRLDVVMIHAVDFRICSIPGEIFSLCEVMIHFDSQEELEEVHRSFPMIQTELRQGLHSGFYARRILEVRGLSPDTKIGMIHEEIAYLITRKPNYFGRDLIGEMQHLLVMCKDEFKERRNPRHLSRIIMLKYLFRKILREEVKKRSDKRYLRLKVFKTTLHQSAMNRPVLAVVVGLNFLTSNEMFEERHLLSAIQTYIPSARAVEGSFFTNTHGNEPIRTFYMEIEKNFKEEFTEAEVRSLRKELPLDLKDRIEHLLHPVFITRNEEEVMRNILSLSNQIKYLQDLPQAIITFDEQTQSSLVFTVIIVQVQKLGKPSVQELFKGRKSSMEYIHDRSRIVGYLRKKYPKEATVFRVKLPKKPFLRQNHSINLNKARLSVVQEINRTLGEVRDFNGGMISKQYELLCAVRTELSQTELSQTKYSDLLLENFFYSLTPDLMRTVLPATVLAKFFLLFLQLIEQKASKGEPETTLFVEEPKGCYLLLKTKEAHLKETLQRGLQKSSVPASKLTSAFVKAHDLHYIGFYYQGDETKQKEFYEAFQQVLKAENPVLIH